MSKPVSFIYHVTTYAAAKSIIDDGFIDPKLSQGKNLLAWFVIKSRVTWAIAHTSRRHNVGIEKLVIFTVKTTGLELLKTNRTGIYCTAHKTNIFEMAAAEQWLDREERYVQVPRGQRKRPPKWLEDDE